MSAASSRQIIEYRRQSERYATEVARLQGVLSQVRLICHDHYTCQCSAAVMILDVIGDK